ncbi:MAG: superoxide dismutase [Ni] [bacterium]|jgi:nickel superoxide dismutase
MKTKAALVLLTLMVPLSAAWSHCQVPCGIYDDDMRLEMIAEHIKTIERSMQQIVELSEAETPNMNQIVRWVNNKDAHADELAHIATYYFLAQRVKPVAATDQDYQTYIEMLKTLHQMVFYSMKAKQSTDMEYVAKLRELLKDFTKAYTGK